ncbi:hypothetical protein [Ideonella alba]|uniref:Uncharacterized protein n=1 Tax=Ideonella alba TaxID=2824118 RepID=A0A941BH26_9BURK|nr:hypothetical protein [Ideonella alba]MBQ0931173.1 hypothetical protein [Ideonella alba]
MPFLVFVLIVGAAAVLLRLGALSAAFALAKVGLVVLALILAALIAWFVVRRGRRP